jgi:hypothetical protein
MSQPSEVRVIHASPPSGPARSFILRVCTENPFYVLSAALFLLGLRLSYGGPVDVVAWWWVMGGLAAYTLLLAGTGALLVRFGNVWDDVRTVLLLTVLMFLATSLTFDQLLFLDPLQGFACILGGLALAVVVTEGVLRTIRLQLPALLRVPYYLALALFFIYPLTMTGLLYAPRDPGLRGEALLWGLFGFSTVAGVVALTLLPAVRRGPRYTADNGSPWRWPLYPWVLFGLLGVAVPVRAYLLCFSMDPLMDDDRDSTIFGPWFLAPFALAVAVVLLESGIVSARRGVLKLALFLPALVVGLTLIVQPQDPIKAAFRDLFTKRCGSDPLLLTLAVAAGFYAYAAVRRVPQADGALTAALVALAFVGPQTSDLHTLRPAQPLPVLGAAALQLVLGLRRRRFARCLAGTTGMAVGLALALPRENDVSFLQSLVAFHATVAGLLTLGACASDPLGRSLRAAGTALLLLACLAVTFGRVHPPPDVPPGSVAVYPLLMAALLVCYGLLFDRLPLAAAAVALVAWLGTAALHGYAALREVLRGLDHMATSLVLFAVAVIVSLRKSGILARQLGVSTGTVAAVLPAAAGGGRAAPPDPGATSTPGG